MTMTTGHFSITQDVRDVLQRATITAAAVVLPAQLERGLYQRVNNVLTKAGGRWNRREAAHVFERDPREVLGLAVETGKATNLQKKFQAFYTPAPLAARMVALAGDLAGRRVLEPSAGHAALALPARAAGAIVSCFDVDPLAVAFLAAEGFEATESDFLKVKPEDHAPFDAVVMNPPFTGHQDIAHVSHALRFLSPGAPLVALVSPRYQIGRDAACRGFRERLAATSAQVEDVPAGTFRESGTDYPTVLVSLRAPARAGATR